MPFLIRWPGVVDSGTHISDLWAITDIFPTLLDIAGAEHPEGLDGQTMLPRLKGEIGPNPERAILLETAYSRGVVTERFKYIANRPPPDVLNAMAEEALQVPVESQRNIGWNGNKATRWEGKGGVSKSHNQYFPDYFDLDQLYDLEKDVFEQSNVAEAHPDVIKEMQAKLKTLLGDSKNPFGEFRE